MRRSIRICSERILNCILDTVVNAVCEVAALVSIHTHSPSHEGIKMIPRQFHHWNKLTIQNVYSLLR